MEKVESIFDYNPTEQELRRFGIKKEYGRYEEQVKEYKEILERLNHPEYYVLGLLFSMRGDKKRAIEYFAKAPSYQQDLLIQDF
jgi:tetratricopeptide (TPR) repeat protein